MRWSSSSRVSPAPGFIEPCVPTPANRAPSGPDWLFELKVDGYRLMVRKDGKQVRIYTRRGADYTARFPRIVRAVEKLKAKSLLIDGEGIVFNKHGMPEFRLIHGKRHDHEVMLAAFDLLEIDGADIRRQPLVQRKGRLQRLLASPPDGLQFVEHINGDGAAIFMHACLLGHEGIVAKRRDQPYESGRSRRWLKIKNPDSPAMQRVRDETF